MVFASSHIATVCTLHSDSWQCGLLIFVAESESHLHYELAVGCTAIGTLCQKDTVLATAQAANVGTERASWICFSLKFFIAIESLPYPLAINRIVCRIDPPRSARAFQQACILTNIDDMQ